MAQTLSLQFENELGRSASITINNPIVPADSAQIAAVMDEIIAKNVFTSTGGNYVTKKGAQITDREVTIIMLPSEE